MFFRDDPHFVSFIWNGALFAIPSANDENRKLLLRASCTIFRTAGMS
jgi:hypothetical protein